MIGWLRAIWHRYFCTCTWRWLASAGAREQQAAFVRSGLPLDAWAHLSPEARTSWGAAGDLVAAERAAAIAVAVKCGDPRTIVPGAATRDMREQEFLNQWCADFERRCN